MTFNALPNGVCNSLCGGDRNFRFEDKQIWKHQNRKICYHQGGNCTLGTDISICDRFDLLQRNERLSNFSVVANRKIIDFLRK